MQSWVSTLRTLLIIVDLSSTMFKWTLSNELSAPHTPLQRMPQQANRAPTHSRADSTDRQAHQLGGTDQYLPCDVKVCQKGGAAIAYLWAQYTQLEDQEYQWKCDHKCWAVAKFIVRVVRAHDSKLLAISISSKSVQWAHTQAIIEKVRSTKMNKVVHLNSHTGLSINDGLATISVEPVSIHEQWQCLISAFS